MPTMLVVLVLSLIRAVQVFDQPYVLTGGGPGTATNYIVQYIYRIGFDPNAPQYGMAAAASVVLAVVLLVLTLVQLRLGRTTDYS
jgi:alpha-1,4-digalacturonate transport system permease protein